MAIRRVSTDATGMQGNGLSGSNGFVFSPDGGKVAFDSMASNLVDGDTNSGLDVFIKDLATGVVTRVSTDATGAQTSGGSIDPVFSRDGTRIAFSSRAANLVSGDTNNSSDIFVKVLATGAVSRVSTSAGEAQGNTNSSGPIFSPDGTKIAFTSRASNLAPGDVNGSGDVFVKDLATGAITRVGTGVGTAQGFDSGSDPVFSPDGQKVAFASNQGRVVDNTFVTDIFVTDLATGSTTRVSTDAAGAEANARSSRPIFSPDGSRIAFASFASNLVDGDTNGDLDIFVKDLISGAITRVSTNAVGTQGNDSSGDHVFSPDGRTIAFSSSASNLVDGDTNGQADVFIKDIASGAITRLSINAAGVQGNGASENPIFSSDGSQLAFSSNASNLVAGDTNGAIDIFIADLAAAPPPSPSTTPTEGDDVLTDTPGNDTINALGGNDRITVTAGSDDVSGGAGNDRLVIDYRLLGNGSVSTNSIAPDAAGGFSGLYLPPSGRIDFTSIENFTISTSITGTGADSIRTGSGDDVISTFGGNDLVDVGGGFDTADGGDGVDGLSADFSGDAAGVSIDLRNAVNTGAFGSFSNFEFFRTITGSAFDDSFLAATPLGVTAGSTFDLGAGNDTATVFNGGNTVNGGTGNDRLIIDATQIGDGAFTSNFLTPDAGGGFSGLFLPPSGRIDFTSIEAFTISTSITGTGADSIRTGSGDDVIRTFGGNDLVDVGGGFDTADGGDGVDGLSADFSGDAAGVSIDLRNAVNTGAFGSFSNFEFFRTITGSAFDDSFLAATPLGVTASSTFDLGAGNDTATVFNGGNIVNGGAGNDRLIIDATQIGDGAFTTNSLTPDAGGGFSGLFLPPSGRIDFTSIEAFTISTSITGTGADSIRTGSGDDVINTFGGNDTVDAGDGADLVDGGAGDDVLNGGAGLGDTVAFATALAGVTVDLRITTAQNTGGAGTDTISNFEQVTGSNFADVLTATDAANVLDGGAGADTLIGLGGTDLYFVDDIGDVVIEQANGGASDQVVTGLASYTLPDNVEVLFGNAGTGQTLTGNGLNNEIYVQGGGSNTINGGGGNDRLLGGLGDDTIDGGTGADSMSGGSGNDIYIVDNAGDVVNEFTGGGTDEVRTALSTYVLNSANVENLTGTSSAGQSLTGDAGANVIIGAGGNDTLSGGGGADTLRGGLGNDIYIVDNAGVTVTENAGGGTDEIRTSLASYTLAANIENLTGTSGIGQSLTGNAGVNVVTGGGGDDTLDGLGGADTLRGGAGNDVYIMGNGDTLVENANEGTDEVRTTSTFFLLAANFENLTGLGDVAQLLIGNEGDNVIDGGGGDDFLRGGGGGADTLIGGTGNDRYFANFGGDAAGVFATIVEAADAGTDEVMVYTRTGNTYELGANVENLTFVDNDDNGGGIGVSTGIGNALANIITGDGGTEILDGRGGADTLSGGGGNDMLIGAEDGSIDTLSGGGGDDVYLIEDADDVIVENANEGIDEVRTSLANYTLAANVERLTYTGTAAAAGSLRGNASNNVITSSTSGADVIFLQDGGDDVASGGAGDDGFYLGAALTAADQIDGGAGDLDQVGLQGNYAGLTLGAQSLTGIEQLVLLSGSDARFGDMSGALYSYNITTIDANVGDGQRLAVTFNTLRAGENVTFNGAAETNGSFVTYGGLGTDILTGGQRDDGFFFGAEGRFGASDRVDGQGGTMDQLGLQGNYTGANAIVLGAGQIANVEMIVLLTGGDARFGSGGAGYSYDLTTSDGNVVGGQVLTISANTLRADETLTFDGVAELDGRYQIFSGDGADTIRGGAGADEIFGRGGIDRIDGGGGDDRIVGGLGGDFLTGGAGADVFVYALAAESTGLGFDTLIGFDFTADRIDLPGDAPAFSDQVQGGRLDQATFDADLAAALDGLLGAGEAALFTADSGSFAGRIFGVVDANGVAGYQAGADYVFEFVAPAAPPSTTIDVFI